MLPSSDDASVKKIPFAKFRVMYFHSSKCRKRWPLFGPCGADAASDERGTSSTAESAPEPPWNALPRESTVYISVLRGGIIARVVHRVMQIREALLSEGMYWYFVFSDCWAAAVDAFDDVEPLPLDEVFKSKKLWRVADGELFVAHTRAKIVGSLSALDLAYALDARIGEFNRLDLLFCKLDALLLSGGAANCKGLFYTSVGEKAESANTKENLVHNLTGDAVDLHADSDVDDAYSIQNVWSDVVAMMRRRDVTSSLLLRHLKRGVGPREQNVFQVSSPEFMSYVGHGLVEMRKLQAAISGAPSKNQEYKELLASPWTDEQTIPQAMRVLEALKEKHASRSLTRKAPLWREYVCFAEVYVDDAHIRMSLSHGAGDRS
jgi:hypothetical protein